MKDEEETVTAVEVSPEVLYQQDKATVDIQVSTSHAWPRNMKKSIENALAIVTMDRETASTCTYSVPRGGKPITGPSVHMAKILAQTFGNMRIQAKVVGVDNKQVTCQAIAWDLETNLAIQVEVKRSIMGKNGRFSDDMVNVTSNAGNAIALRNAILSVIPRAVVDKVYKAAIQTITGDVSDENKLNARRKQVIDGLKDTYSVTEAEILAVVGKASVSHVDGDDLATLIGVGTAIKDGDTTVDQAFRKKKESTPDIDPNELLSLYEKVKEKLTKKEREDSERIIFGREENSFSKLKKLLESKIEKV